MCPIANCQFGCELARICIKLTRIRANGTVQCGAAFIYLFLLSHMTQLKFRINIENNNDLVRPGRVSNANSTQTMPFTISVDRKWNVSSTHHAARKKLSRWSRANDLCSKPIQAHLSADRELQHVHIKDLDKPIYFHYDSFISRVWCAEFRSAILNCAGIRVSITGTGMRNTTRLSFAIEMFFLLFGIA